MPDSAVIRSFEDAMTAAGFIVPGGVITDTADFQRIDAPGDKKNRQNGFYKLITAGDWPVGWFGDWKDAGNVTQWAHRSKDTLTKAERDTIKLEHARLKAEEAAARAMRAAEVAEDASKYWKGAGSDAGQHPYIARKQIQARGVRIHIASDQTELLAVPMWAFDADGNPGLQSLQMISPDGVKRFLKAGRVDGCFFSIKGQADIVVICEGYATAASIWEATGFSVVAAFNAGNLTAVAKAFKDHRPGATLLIAGDDDRHVPEDWKTRGGGKLWVNAGRLKTEAAAKAVSARWVLPSFQTDESRPTDFNDLHRLAGLVEVRAQIEAALGESEPPDGFDAPADPETTPNSSHGTIDPKDVSEDAIARAFTATHRNDMRYDHDARRWYHWDGARWKLDDVQRAFQLIRKIGSKMSGGNKSICRANVAAGAERFARSDEAHAMTAEQWDSNPMLLASPGGTIDLHTGHIRPANPNDLITRSTSCKPKVGTPTLWLQFLNDATEGDEGLIRFLRQWCGYCLTGHTREHALLFVYGPGGTGKSVFLNIVSRVMADLAVNASMDTFTAARFDRHSTELAMLSGARVVTASETEEGRSWAEAKIKSITGGDRITARFMRKDFFTFQPQFKLIIAGNHAPALSNVDDAMKRRFNIVPFTKKPAIPDRLLEEKLRAEDGLILAWMIAGCLDWQENGLVRPDSVIEATADYFDEQGGGVEEAFAIWHSANCVADPDGRERTMVIRDRWKLAAEAAGVRSGSDVDLSRRLQALGYRKGKNGTHGRFYSGIRFTTSVNGAGGRYGD